jgi:nucleoside-diphosphate-sugar epimerase
MLKGERPLVFGDGTQARDFTYVQNAVSANLLAAKAPAEKAAGRVFNTAAGDSISLLDLIAELNALTNQSLEPVFQAPRVGDVKNSRADISAARAALEYEVLVNWKEGVARTLDFYRESA